MKGIFFFGEMSARGPAPVVTEPRRVVIAGGGIIGAATAYYLRKKGGNDVDVTILEQEGIACHSSGKAAGFLASDWNYGAVGELSELSFKLHQELSEELLSGAGAAGGMNAAAAEPKNDGDAKNSIAAEDVIGYRKMTCIGIGAGTGMHADDGRKWLDRIGGESRDMGSEQTVAQVHPRKLTERLVEKSGAKVVARAYNMALHAFRVASWCRFQKWRNM